MKDKGNITATIPGGLWSPPCAGLYAWADNWSGPEHVLRCRSRPSMGSEDPPSASSGPLGANDEPCLFEAVKGGKDGAAAPMELRGQITTRRRPRG